MQFVYQQIKINIEKSGSGMPLLILHGWGVDSKVMQPLAAHFAKHFTVYNFDLPGFGASEPPKEVWGTEEYAAMVEAFCKQEGLIKPIVVAHSFGGRLALRLGAKGVCGKMIITGGAGIKPKRGADYYVKVYSYKAMKHLLDLPGLKGKKEEILNKRRQSSGSEDYRRADGIMRQIFVKVVNEDLKFLLPQVKSSTLLFWGEQDTATPLADGELMNREIPDAGLVKVSGTHYAFLERLDYFLLVCDSFLEKEMNC